MVNIEELLVDVPPIVEIGMLGGILEADSSVDTKVEFLSGIYEETDEPTNEIEEGAEEVEFLLDVDVEIIVFSVITELELKVDVDKILEEEFNNLLSGRVTIELEVLEDIFGEADKEADDDEPSIIVDDVNFSEASIEELDVKVIGIVDETSKSKVLLEGVG